MPLRRLKEFAVLELDRLKDDPFGETSIDPHVQESDYQEQRSVNKLRKEIQDLIPLPIAIKSSFEQSDSFYGKEDLVDQFILMRQLRFRSQERLDERLKQILEFLPVYGVIRFECQEYLFMKLIKDAKEIEDVIVPYPCFGWIGSGEPDYELALPVADHTHLLETLGFDVDFYNNEASYKAVRYRYLTGGLEGMLDMRLHDLAGRNILYTQDRGKRRYFIIDQVSKDRR